MVAATFSGTAIAKDKAFKVYADPATAARYCRSTVVWADPESKTHAYHLPGSEWFGKTKIGAYLCQAEMDSIGWHAAPN
jgi:hypothetical protein